MKIGFDAKRAFNNHRGLGTYSRETLRILTTLVPENEYHLFTPCVEMSFPYASQKNVFVHEPAAFFLGKVFQDYWRTYRIAWKAESLSLDVYHGLSHELPVGIEKTKTHTVVTMHDLLFIKHPELFPKFDREMYRKKYLRSCKVADRIIAVSKQTKRDLLELTNTPEGKVEVVYQGCRPEFKRLVSETQKKSLKEKYRLPEDFLLNVGAIEPRKNQMLILKALKAGKIDMPLVIAGRKTDYMKELQQFIAKNGLQSQVMLLPDFPENELPALYQCATLFVFPSTYEGFGIPVVEALTSGIPVIAATGSCLEESGGPDSVYVSPNDEEELAARINELLANEQRRRSMMAKGLAYAQRFSDQAIADHLIRNYKSLLS